MIRFALVFLLSATPALACQIRPAQDLLDHRMVQNLVAEGDWDISGNPEALEATCFDCPDERGFILFVLPHNETSLSAAITAMDREREAFCAQIASDGSGRCATSEVRDLQDLPGRSRRMDLGPLTFVSDEFICG